MTANDGKKAVLTESDTAFTKTLTSDEIKTRLKPKIDLIKEYLSEYSEEEAIGLISGILLASNEAKSDAPLPKKVESQMTDIALKADKLIRENIFNPKLNVKFVADNLYISSSYLYRCSIHIFGVSVSEHINNRKIEKACELIRSEKNSLSEISYSLNFCSQSYFCTRFKKKCGVSPMQYAKEEKASYP